MGLEADCVVRFGGKTSSGKARLEEKELIFRGDADGLRLKIPFADIRRLSTRGGALAVEFPGGRAVFALGPKAETWAGKIQRPRSLIDKLGVKPGAKVAVIDLEEPQLLDQIEERAGKVLCRLGKGFDLVLVGMSRKEDLARLARCREAIEPDGAVWVIWPKGGKAFREDDVRAAGPAAGLVDVKVVSVSDTLSGLKMMVPRAQRR